jgi:hypothetical protein
MPIDTKSLDTIAHDYVQAMTSIRGRRVHRLLMREFARFDHVLPALAEDGSRVLLALAADGRAALCRTDGTGAAAALSHWARLPGATLATRFDLTKDSLPVVGWTVWHPAFAQCGGTLTIAAGAGPEAARALASLLA